MQVDKLLKLGLTGCAGSGKSEAAKTFSSLFVKVVDADRIARRLVEPHQPCYKQIVELFGPSSCGEDGRLDRRLMRKTMLNDAAAKQALESILHPLIRKELIAESKKAAAKTAYCVLMVPLLIESGMVDVVDRVLVLDCKEETCIKRLCARDRCGRQEARALIGEQMPQGERLKFAQFVIDNNGDKDALAKQVKGLHKRLLAEVKNGKTIDGHL